MRRYRRVWQVDFARGGEAALELLAQEPADVVVADMQMPGMDGATLLTARAGPLSDDDPDDPLRPREPAASDPRRDRRTQIPRQAVQHRRARAADRALVRAARADRTVRGLSRHRGRDGTAFAAGRLHTADRGPVGPRDGNLLRWRWWSSATSRSPRRCSSSATPRSSASGAGSPRSATRSSTSGSRRSSR